MYLILVSINKTPQLTIESSWRTLHYILEARGRGNCEGCNHYNMAFKSIGQSICFNYGRSHYNMAFYCQWPIKSFTEISVSLAFASIFWLTIRPDVRLGVQGWYVWMIETNLIFKLVVTAIHSNNMSSKIKVIGNSVLDLIIFSVYCHGSWMFQQWGHLIVVSLIKQRFYCLKYQRHFDPLLEFKVSDIKQSGVCSFHWILNKHNN